MFLQDAVITTWTDLGYLGPVLQSAQREMHSICRQSILSLGGFQMDRPRVLIQHSAAQMADEHTMPDGQKGAGIPMMVAVAVTGKK